MLDAFICDGIRTPIGRYGGALAKIRTDDLAALPIKALMDRNPEVDWGSVEDVIYGCANQAGEDNRNVARFAGLLAGLPPTVPGATINRLCGSGMNAVIYGVRYIKTGNGELILAGGVESMSRAPFVMAKGEAAWSRKAEVYDTTIGWRFVNKIFEKQYGIDSMGETAENVAEEHGISRKDQDAFAARSQARAETARENGNLAAEITPVSVPGRKGDDVIVEHDEHPRPGADEAALAKLKPAFRQGGSVTAGNSSGINDGAAALVLASEAGAKANGLRLRARVLAGGVVGVEPRVMGLGPWPASEKVLGRAGLTIKDMDVIELNEAFAAQGLAVLRKLGVADDDDRVNSNGGAIALGHPLGMSGARLMLTAVNELERRQGRYALCAMCIGVGQGIATIIERVS